MNTKLLEELGFTAKETDVYLALLKLKHASIFEIMGRANVSRKRIYEILQKLLNKGLISYTTENNKKLFQAASPERLLDVLQEQEARLKEKENEVRLLLPELLAKYNENKSETTVEVFIGKDGIRTMANNIIKVRKPVYILSGDGKIWDLLKYYMPQFTKSREKMKIHLKMIYNESVRAKNRQLPLAEIRYAPEKYSLPMAIAVYGDNVNKLISSENPIGIQVQSKEIAQLFMNYFDLMWKIAKK